ncbi:MAG: serine/threonine-protein kinase [Candidatus Microbacterium phytovorans]|uniref:non-specific serine/threonine protein kinase n=1 Tax=Candidatus Microbacterium phytovorans TaxID=3121374 RepID=A0AAJ5W2Q5_9MICO|nr:serine/threonine-protein kinase [Microbacterium sp.]WEK13636.1 MAG: serine/threonine-protein kinase [Microbacterium sp.]
MTSPIEGEHTAELLGGRYAVGDCIGRGAMADVHRADDVILGRAVAVKMLRTPDDGSNPAPRARVEMALLASLNHHSLVTLYDARIEPGMPSYLVMELIDGPSLAEELRRGPQDARTVALLAADLAGALEVVHAAGVVHRDIKPSNILLANDPLPGRPRRAKLADFGVAHIADGARYTSPGFVIGTAAYLAPEQVRGAAPAPPADIYALGLVLREALTAQRAYPDATGIGAAMARLVESPAIPAWFGPEWTELLTRMTASDPAERPTAQEVAVIAATLPGDVSPDASTAGGELTEPTDTDGSDLDVFAALIDTDESPTVVAPPVLAATASPPSYPPPPPLPVGAATDGVASAAPAAAATASFDTATADAVPRGSRRERSLRRRRRRTRVAVVVGSALTAAVIIGLHAAGWVGGASIGPTEVETVPSPSSSVVEPLADTDLLGGTETDTDEVTTVTVSVDEPTPQDENAARKAERDAAKTAAADERAAAKAAREEQKAAAAAERDAAKQQRDAAKGKPGKADKPGKPDKP